MYFRNEHHRQAFRVPQTAERKNKKIFIYVDFAF